MLINDAAKAANLTEDTIRFYEKSGMLPQIARDGRGWRRFSPADIDWLKTLGHLRATGMPLADVKAFAVSAHGMDADTRPAQALRLDILRRHAARLDDRRAELDACQTYLSRKIAVYSTELERA